MLTTCRAVGETEDSVPVGSGSLIEWHFTFKAAGCLHPRTDLTSEDVQQGGSNLRCPFMSGLKTLTCICGMLSH